MVFNHCFPALGNLMKPEARVFEISSPTNFFLVGIVILRTFRNLIIYLGCGM